MGESVEEARARVERELRERLDHRAAPATFAAPVVAPRVSSAVATIGLRCVECNAICASDARFCISCGVRFNARIVVRGRRWRTHLAGPDVRSRGRGNGSARDLLGRKRTASKVCLSRTLRLWVGTDPQFR